MAAGDGIIPVRSGGSYTPLVPGAAGTVLTSAGPAAVPSYQPPPTDHGITRLTGDVTAGPGDGSQAATIAANAVTYPKIQKGTQGTILGFPPLGAPSTVPANEISLGSNLTLGSGTTLDTVFAYSANNWTPMIGSSGGGSGQTYSRQQGEYVKIGRMCVLNFNIALTSKGTLAGNVVIPLPFACGSLGSSQSYLFPLRWYNLLTNWVQVMLEVVGGSTNGAVEGIQAASAYFPLTALTYASDIGNTSILQGTFCYPTTS